MTPNGLVPVEGVLVQEANSRRQVRTGADGLYTLSGVSGASNSISVSGLFYVTQTRALTISADTRLDITVVRVPTYTLSGVVFEVTPAGRVPIAEVSVYCDSCGSPSGHTFVTTDARGFYSFDWTANGSVSLIVEKSGFRLPGGSIATVNGNTQFDIELVRQ
jgi:hypothetical protein